MVAELRRISWPTIRETLSTTLGVVVLVGLGSAILLAFDEIVSFAVTIIFAQEF